MKRIIIAIIAIVSLMMPNLVSAKAAKVDIKHVQPGFWWAGMKNPELQVLIHGANIGDYDVVLEGEDNVKISNVVKPENKNYIILYLDTKFAKAQKFNIDLKKGKKTVKSIAYELKERDGRKFKSFDSSDVLYLLMPDRFANGNTKNDVVATCKDRSFDPQGERTRHGGDIAGLEQHLDYLDELGVTAIWTTPIFENDMKQDSFHGYAITDYYNSDPRFGTLDEVKHFIDAAHAKGMKYVLDIVFNHCGSENFLFVDRPANDWFHNNSEYVQTSYRTAAVNDPYSAQSELESTVDGWFVETMPDFNHQNRLVMDYLIQASIWWIEYMHVDGIRQDTYPYNDFQSMKRWCQEIEEQYPGFNIVGEVWINNVVGCAYWQKDCKFAKENSYLPSVMDFPLMYILDYVADEETNDWDKGLSKVSEHIGQDAIFANPLNVLTMLDNHDTDRFARTQELAEKTYRYKQALTLLATLRGIPQLYYGDEIAMVGTKEKGDWAVRRDFPGCQPGDKNNAFTEAGRTPLQKEYFDFAKTVLQWRRGNNVVAYGHTRQYAVKNGVYVYARQYQGKTVTVVINGNDKDVTVADFAGRYNEVLPADKAYEVTTKKTMAISKDLHLDARQVMILDFAR